MAARFVARPSPIRILLLIAGSVGFVAGSLWIAGAFGAAPRPSQTWIGWFGAAFFGACGVGGVHLLVDRNDQIVIDGRGIYWRRWSPETIPWEAVAAMEVRSVNRQKFLSIFLTDPDRYRSTRLLGQLAKLNKVMGFGDISLSASGTDRSFDELLDAIDAHFPPESDMQKPPGDRRLA